MTSFHLPNFSKQALAEVPEPLRKHVGVDRRDPAERDAPIYAHLAVIVTGAHQEVYRDQLTQTIARTLAEAGKAAPKLPTFKYLSATDEYFVRRRDDIGLMAVWYVDQGRASELVEIGLPVTAARDADLLEHMHGKPNLEVLALRHQLAIADRVARLTACKLLGAGKITGQATWMRSVQAHTLDELTTQGKSSGERQAYMRDVFGVSRRTFFDRQKDG